MLGVVMSKLPGFQVKAKEPGFRTYPYAPFVVTVDRVNAVDLTIAVIGIERIRDKLPRAVKAYKSRIVRAQPKCSGLVFGHREHFVSGQAKRIRLLFLVVSETPPVKV